MNYLHENYFFNPMSIHNNLALFTEQSGENNLSLMSYIERTKSYLEAYKEALNLGLSRFKLNGGEENGIDESFLFSVLLELGGIAFVEPKSIDKKAKAENNIINLICQPFNAARRNYYCLPTEIDIIPYYNGGVTLSDLGLQKTYKADEFEIVYYNKAKNNLSATFERYAKKYSMLDILSDNNIIAKSLQIILEGSNGGRFDVKQILLSILNQNGILPLDSDRGLSASEMIHTPNLNIEWLQDKINQAKFELKRELLDKLGIKHAPYEKKERLIEIEIQTQDEATDLINQACLDEINKGLERVNKRFNLVTPLSAEFTSIGINDTNTENIEESKEVDINNAE